MKYLFFTCFVLLCIPALGRTSIAFLGKVVVLEDSLGAALANRSSDAYTAGLTPFDLAIRLNTDAPLTEGDYLRTAAQSMRSWSASDRDELRSAFAVLEQRASRLGIRLPLPDTIYVCSTRGREEFGAEGYTRGNRMMLNAASDALTPGLVAHELWHVISRLSPKTRGDAYAVFGFRPCNRVDYKPAFKEQVITNPDCPFIEHYIRVGAAGRQRDFALVLYSRSPYVKGGGLMDYAAVSLLELEGDDAHKRPLLRDGKPVLIELGNDPVSADFYRQASRNTGYMLHVEELTAEHFATLMTGGRMADPRFVDMLAAALK